jgi:hypothetical protein
LIQPKRIGQDLREAARALSPVKVRQRLNEVSQRVNPVSEVLNTKTALDLIAVTEAALKEIVELGHELAPQVILVTDNGRR